MSEMVDILLDAAEAPVGFSDTVGDAAGISGSSAHSSKVWVGDDVASPSVGATVGAWLKAHAKASDNWHVGSASVLSS